MTSVLSQEEIDELLSAIQIGDDYIDPIPRFYKRLSVRLRDFLGVLTGATVSVGEPGKIGQPGNESFTFPDNRYVMIDIGQPGMQFLVSFGDPGMGRLLALACGNNAGSPTGLAAHEAATDIYQRISAMTRSALLLPEQDGDQAQTVTFPLTEEAWKSGSWAPGYAIPLRIGTVVPGTVVPGATVPDTAAPTGPDQEKSLVFFIYPTTAAAEAMPGPMTGSVSPEQRIKIYDFRRPDKFSKDQMCYVQIMHETFARVCSASLTDTLRMLAPVHVASVDQLSYEEFIRSVPGVTTMAVIGMDPLKGKTILQIDPGISFTVIDRLFGGPGEYTNLTRKLTDIEHPVMEGVIANLVENLAEAWKGVLDLRPRLCQIVDDPQLAQIVPPTEMVLLVTLETRIDKVESTMNLCIPYATIKPILPRLSFRYRDASGTGSTGKRKLLNEAELGTTGAQRYASFSLSPPGLTAHDLEARLSDGTPVELATVGRFEYEIN